MPRCLLVLLLVVLATPSGRGQEGYLRFLPSDTRLVITFRPQVAIQAEDRKHEETLFHRLVRDHLLPDLADDEPLALTDVTRVVIGLPYAGSANGCVILEGKIDNRRLQQQFQAELKKGGLRVEQQGNPAVAVYSRALNESKLLEMVPILTKLPASVRKLVAPQEIHLAILDERTVFLSLAGKTPLQRALRARAPGSRPRTTPELTALLRTQREDERLTVVLLDDSLFPGLSLLLDDPTREVFTQFDHTVLRMRGEKKIEILVDVQSKSSEQGQALEKRSRHLLKEVTKILPDVLRDQERRKVVEDLIENLRIQRKEEQLQLRGELPVEGLRKFR